MQIKLELSENNKTVYEDLLREMLEEQGLVEFELVVHDSRIVELIVTTQQQAVINPLLSFSEND